MKRLFPMELLEQPPSSRISYFIDYTVEHPRLEKATTQLWQAINSRVQDTLIFVYGPTGVGKTTLCKQVVRKIIEKKLADPEFDRSKHIPVAFIESATPENRHFDWKDFYHQAMHAVQSSLFEKAKPSFIKYNPRLTPALYFNNRLKPCELRSHFIHTLKTRKPEAVFVDEAQNFGKVARGQKLLDQMDVLKTIASFSPARLILTGPYELLNFRNLSGQLSRRSRDVHFARYDTTAEDLNDFKSAVWAFQRHLPTATEPDLVNQWEYLYTKSIGCIGTLKDWLTRAFEISLDENAPTITLEILERCALSDDQCENIAIEVAENENIINGSPHSYKRLQILLGLREPDPDLLQLLPSGVVDAQSIEANGSKSKFRISPVGRRNPKRDLINSPLSNQKPK